MPAFPNSLTPAANFLARRSAMVALALFAAVGGAIFDDYGIAHDEPPQRSIGYASFNYILGDEDALNALTENLYINRFYAVAFEVPLIVAERVLGLEDSRDVYLSRRLLTHLFFLAGGLFAWLLAYRLFGSRLVALIAMLLFLTHPRLYAHSFFNTKDLPFLSMFIIALYLTHRAFRRDSVWAFAICGAGVGLLANIRIMGVMLLPAVLGMLALDAFYGMKRGGGVKHAIANIGAFLTAFAAIFYAAWPLLWRDPLNLIEAAEALSIHPLYHLTLFRGEFVRWPNVPWDFIPTWILITTPPVALILAALGVAALARLCAADWRGALANSTARFGLLAVGCLILPVAAALALNSNLYDDWRQMYFLYAPLCVLSAFGLRALADVPRPNLRAAAFALTALGIALAGVGMVRLHPYQNEYFSPLVDKSALADRWQMGYWEVARKEAFEAVLETQPAGRVAVTDPDNVLGLREFKILPKDARSRLEVNPNFPSFIIVSADQRERGKREYDGYSVIRTREVYGVPLISILDARAESEAAFHAAYAAARASRPDASGGGFDLYSDGGELVYVKDDCGEDDARGTFALSVFPLSQDDALSKPEWNADLERLSFDFEFHRYGAILGGKCVIVRDLSDYPTSHIETGRRTPGGEGDSWSARIPFDYYDRYRDALASLPGEPAIRSDFDVYTEDGALIYVKETCAETDARGRFFLSVFPADPRDLPKTARDAGLEHEPLNFDFDRRGVTLDGKCVIVRDLPDYPISRIETGQWTEREGEMWSAKIQFEPYSERYRRALSSLSGEPAIRSDFDVYMEDGKLTYVKSPCGEADARGRFILSVFPADPRDLPQSAVDAGFDHEPLNFDFDQYGAILDGKCVIVRNLPDYPISRVETGQFIPEEGELWRGRAAVGD